MLDKWSKDDRDSFVEQLKRSVIQLTKIRHPQILTVQHPLEESRESLAFATEPVFASLANVLGDTSNLPSPNNVAGELNFKCFYLFLEMLLYKLEFVFLTWCLSTMISR